VLGLAVGDALGAALEWLAPEQITARFGGPLRDMVASPAWQMGEWTDDTAMMLELGESLADRGGWDEDDVLARYIVWARSGPKDIGTTVQRALARARTPDDARLAASGWHEESGGRSAGPLQVIRLVILPSALPGMITGLRVGAGFAFRGLVFAEIIAAKTGIGYLIFEGTQTQQTARTIVGMIVMGLLWLGMDQFYLRPLERATVQRWGLLVEAEQRT